MLFLLLLIGDEHNDLNVSEPQRPYLPMNEGKHHNLNVHILCVIFLVVRWRGWSQDSTYGDNEDSLSHNGCCTDPFHSTFSSSMFNITLSFVSYVSIKPKLQHPPWQPCKHLNFWRLVISSFCSPPPSPRPRSHSNAPPNIKQSLVCSTNIVELSKVMG